jgi:hypothetical protein
MTDKAALLILGRDFTDLEQAVDEHPQACLRRNPPGRHVRTVQQPQIFKILHDIADRRGGHLFRQGARQSA